MAIKKIQKNLPPPIYKDLGKKIKKPGKTLFGYCPKCNRRIHKPGIDHSYCAVHGWIATQLILGFPRIKQKLSPIREGKIINLPDSVKKSSVSPSPGKKEKTSKSKKKSSKKEQKDTRNQLDLFGGEL